MSYCAEFTGCSDLTILDLIVVYRKAKTALFFENSFPTAVNFAKYEDDLLLNSKNKVL